MRVPGVALARCAAICLVTGIAISGCDFVGTRTTVSVALPRLPGAWPLELEIDAYRLTWRDAAGGLQRLRVSGRQREVTVTIPKRPGSAVLAECELADGRFILQPAAAVYPHDRAGPRRLRASFERGFTGLVLHRAGHSVPSFNSARLIEEVSARADGNPWRFDLHRVTEKLAGGSFSTIYLRPRDTVTVAIPAAPGSYVSDNALRPPIVVGPPAGSLTTELTPGHHRFLNARTGAVLSVVVEEDGSLRVFER